MDKRLLAMWARALVALIAGCGVMIGVVAAMLMLGYV